MYKAKSKARLYVSGALSTGAVVELTSGQLHYVARVMRIEAGDSVLLFNGHDGEWQATIQNISKKQCSLQVTEQTREQEKPFDVWLAFAPVKKSRTDFIVEKATELGAERLFPVFTQFTASKRVNVERLTSIAIEAAEQCHRLNVPVIDQAQQLAALCQDWPESRTLFVLDELGYETGNAEPILSVLESAKYKDGATPVGFLTGPEGGFDTSELDLLRNLPFFKPLTLGSRILRAETAVAAALACYRATVDKL
jgi:16S rRNA (uracil1498-N3)-methyltransferase